MNWKAPSDTQGSHVLEAVIRDWDASGDTGYGESKLVSENLLAAAAETSGIRTAIYRVGQIIGPIGHPAGRRPKQEWTPFILATSKSLGCLPEDLGPADRVEWVPVNIVAKTLAELFFGGDGCSVNPRVHHLVNPSSTKWSESVQIVANYFSNPTRPKLVSFTEWPRLLQRKAREGKGDEPTNLPALRISAFLEDVGARAGG